MFMQASLLRTDGTDIASMMACHHLDMCMELSLKTTLTYLDPTSKIKGVNFSQLWYKTNEIYQLEFSNNLPYRNEINNLRNLRNSVQHEGIIPSVSDLTQYETRVKSFLDEVLQQVFSLNLEGIYLSELIDDTKIKQIMEEAESSFYNNEYDLSVEKLSIVFELGKKQKLREIKNRHYSGMWSNLLLDYNINNVDMNFGFRGGIGSGIRELDDIGRDLEKVRKLIDNLVNYLMKMGRQISDELDLFKSINDVLMLGLNYLEYSQFKKVSYTVQYTANQEYYTYRDKNIMNTKEEAQFCLNFVFNALLLWRS